MPTAKLSSDPSFSVKNKIAALPRGDFVFHEVAENLLSFLSHML